MLLCFWLAALLPPLGLALGTDTSTARLLGVLCSAGTDSPARPPPTSALSPAHCPLCLLPAPQDLAPPPGAAWSPLPLSSPGHARPPAAAGPAALPPAWQRRPARAPPAQG